MRAEVISYLEANLVSGFAVTRELPWDSNGQPLYEKNFKRIYVDQDQVSQETLIAVLNGSGVINQTVTVSAYVTTDAKNTPSNLNSLITTMTAAAVGITAPGTTQRVTQVSSVLTGDSQTMQFEFSSKQLIVNQ